MKIHSVEAELFDADGRTGGRKGRHDEASKIYYRGMLDQFIYHFLES